MDSTRYFDRLVETATRVVRHSYYPGKEEAIELCLEELDDLRSAGRISGEERTALRELLTGEESSFLAEGVIREREHAEESSGRDRIAIVCQGVGGQAAFAAGVLQGLLGDRRAGGEIAALTGTSCGAISALVAWDGLLRGDFAMAADQLEQLWHDYSANSLVDAFLNVSTQMVLHFRSLVPIGGLDTYGLPSAAPAWDGWRRLLERRIDFDEARVLALRDDAPRFVLGSMDLRGEVELLRGQEITVESILSATRVAQRAGPIGLNSHAWRDESRLPIIPIRALMSVRPTEIWIIQIQKADRGSSAVRRRNLDDPDGIPGNLLLEQELRFLQKINRLLEWGSLIDGHYRHIEVHRIAMDHDLGDVSKFDRSPVSLPA